MEIIKTINLTKQFGDFTANSNISLSVNEQEIKCIVGENGAGKSTLMNMLYGVFKPTSGHIYIRGEEVHFSSPADSMAHGIGMVHQHFKLVSSLSVYENILLGTEIHHTTKKGLKTPFIDNKKRNSSSKRLNRNIPLCIKSSRQNKRSISRKQTTSRNIKKCSIGM